MSWGDCWRGIAARIDSLTKAGELTASAFKVNSSDPFSVVRKSLMPELEEIKQELSKFRDNYEKSLPEVAATSLARFLNKDWKGAKADDSINIQAIIPFAVFRSEFEFLIHDIETHAKNLIELAFEHLRRILTVDTEVQRKWVEAFDRRENYCEALGAVHLLSHGIWAFKVSATGGATDLVFGNPISSEADLVTRTARALVLTEWKLVKKLKDLETKAGEARRQTDLYSGGVLGGMELKSTRYIVLVTRKSMPAPENTVINGITFRHIILAISPAQPSVEARQG